MTPPQAFAGRAMTPLRRPGVFTGVAGKATQPGKGSSKTG